MSLVQRAIDQDKELDVALKSIEKAAGENDTRKAYQVYRELVKKFPSLDANARLNAAVLLVGQRERGLVKVIKQNVEAGKADDSSAVAKSQVLALRTGDSAPGGKGLFTAVLAGSSVFGIDVENGHVMWRRFVGQGTRNHPQRFTDQPNADVLCADTARQELLRCRVQDGIVAWRLSLKDAFTNPVIAGKSVYVATNSGHLWEIDAESGRSPRYAEIPQKLITGPAVAPNRPRAFQPGEHSNIYVISTDTLECKEVYYLGHKAGSIDIPPLAMSQFLFVVENAGSDYALLHAISIRSEGDGPSLKAAQAPIRLTGNVRVPLVPYGRRLLAMTDRGEICVFDIDVANAAEPVKEAAKLPPVNTEPVVGYPLTDGSSLWIADNRLTNYRIQVTTREINRNPAIADVGDTFVAPLQLFQNVLVHVRRVKDSAGTTIAAVSTENPRKPLWETSVGTPVSLVSVDSQSQEVTAVTAGAAAYSIPSAQLGQACLDQPAKVAAGTAGQSYTRSVSFEDGSAALISTVDAKRMIHVVPGPGGGQLTPVEIKSLDGQASCPPAAFQQSVLLLTDKGSIRLIDPNTGADRAMPYQPKLEPGETIRWLKPAPAADAKELFAADDRKFIYRVALRDQPQPSLAEVSSLRMEEELSSGLAAAGTFLFVVARTSASDVVMALNQADLKVAQQWDLKGGRVSWGPERIGDSVLALVDGKSIHCFGPDGKSRWEQPAAAFGQPAGPPLQVGGDFVFASTDGQVWRIQGGDGKTAGRSVIGEPLSRGPVAFGDQLLLAGNDGVLLVAPVPSGS
jgi:outer membrane protein assembly factor BamB